MGIEISAINQSSQVAVSANKKNTEKPTWNSSKAYNYVEDMSAGLGQYKTKAIAYYRRKSTEQMSVDDLKKEIADLFPEYTMTSSEPKLTKGKNYLYIDDTQLKKMANDPAYRATVYGWMDTELQGMKGYTLRYSDGRNITAHLTGTVFSLSGHNKKNQDGIPYQGSCMTDNGVWAADSHPQFKNTSFLTDYNKPKKAIKNTKKSMIEIMEEKRAKRREEQKRQEKIEEKRRQKEIFEESLEDKIQERFDARA